MAETGYKRDMARKTTKTRMTDCNTMIGQWLKRERTRAGLSQTLLAKKIGKPRSFVVDYEAGKGGLEINLFMLVTKIMHADALSGIELIISKSVF